MAVQEQDKLGSTEGLLKRALRHRCCPICAILEDLTRDLLCKLQFEAVHKQEVNAMVVSASGYCHYHFWYLERLASPVTNARLLEDLLKKIEKEYLNDDSGDAAASFSGASCPVCSYCKDNEQKLLLSFAESMRQPDFSAAYENSSGLCLPHLSQLLNSVSGTDDRGFLVKTGRAQLSILLGELRLMMTKARNKDRSRGGESDAAYRAIAKITGGKNYRAG